MKKWRELLSSVGLTDSEQKVYLSTLESGESSVQHIAKKTKLSRVTVYSVVETLTQYGLMSSVEKGKKTYHIAEPPERLITFGEEQLQKIKSTVSDMKSRIHDLKTIQSGSKPIVKLYEGKEAIAALQTDFLSLKKINTVREFGNLDIIKHHVLPERDLKPFYKKLESKRITRKLMFLSGDHKPVKRGSEEYIIFDAKNKFEGDVFTYGNRVAISTFKGKHIVVLIENDVIADTINELLDQLWDRHQHTKI